LKLFWPTRTPKIARAKWQKYGAPVLDDDRKNMEEGKRLALHHATGKPAFLNGAANLPS
jgi:hypothetical protein